LSTQSNAYTRPLSIKRSNRTSRPRPIVWKRRRWRWSSKAGRQPRTGAGSTPTSPGGALLQLLSHHTDGAGGRHSLGSARTGQNGRGGWPHGAILPAVSETRCALCYVEDVLKYSQKEFLALELPDADAPVDARLDGPRHEPRQVFAGRSGSGRRARRSPVDVLAGESRHLRWGVEEGCATSDVGPILKNDCYVAPDPRSTPRFVLHGNETAPSRSNSPSKCRDARETGQFLPAPGPADGGRSGAGAAQHPRDAPDDLICRSSSVLGNGTVRTSTMLWLSNHHRFNRGDSVRSRPEVRNFNMELVDRKIPYLLIGVGRWGSADPWLGIPVRWQDINGARIIVEAALKDVKVAHRRDPFLPEHHVFQDRIHHRARQGRWIRGLGLAGGTNRGQGSSVYQTPAVRPSDQYFHGWAPA